MSRTKSSTLYRAPMRVPESHFVHGTPLTPPFAKHLETAIFGMGCFWGAEKGFWEMEGVYSTAVGYAGGVLEHPTYSDVCSGDTGHAEVVLVVYDPEKVSYEQLLKTFWRGHSPARRSRSSDDSGYQYRSAIFTTMAAQAETAHESRERYENELSGDDRVFTEIADAPTFYYAEEKHQQYSAKRDRGYRAFGG